MNKDRLKDSEGKYWDGKSSLEDEQYLKETKDDVYFKGLKAAKEEELTWGFDDFLHQVEEEKSITQKHKINPIWKYISIAAALLLVGFIFLKNQTIESEWVEEEKPSNLSTTSPTTVNQEEKRASPSSLSVALKKVEEREAVPLEQTMKEPEEAYVVVNGKPIYNEQEAEEIILASLQLMASNFQEGRQAVEKMKYMKIEL